MIKRTAVHLWMAYQTHPGLFLPIQNPDILVQILVDGSVANNTDGLSSDILRSNALFLYLHIFRILKTVM